MSKKYHSLFTLIANNVADEQQALQTKLIHHNHYFKPNIQRSYEQIEDIFLKNKVLEDLIEEEKERGIAAKRKIQSAEKRLNKIKELNSMVNKQTTIVRGKTQKIKDALMLNKILMMEKVVKLQRQAEDLSRKKQLYSSMRAQKQQSGHIRKQFYYKKLQKIRLQNLQDSFDLKDQILQNRCNTMQLKRRQANQVREQHERQKAKSRKIQNFKQVRAQKNYLQKFKAIQNDIDEKQIKLLELAKMQHSQKVKIGVSKKVTSDCLVSFFTTEASI